MNKPRTRARAAAGARPNGGTLLWAGLLLPTCHRCHLAAGRAVPVPPAWWDLKEQLVTSLAALQVKEQP